MATKIETIKKGSDFIAPRTKTSAITDSNDVSLDTLLSGKQSTLTAGQNISISNNTISATDTTYNNATTSASGLMSASDKTKLDGISANAKNVSVSATGTSTDEVQYITIDGTEKKLAGGGSVVALTTQEVDTIWEAN